MRYREHIPFLNREIEALGSRPFDLSFRSFLEVLRSVGSLEADAACRVFAATLQWPPVSDQVRLELCMRLECALWWCGDLEYDEIDDDEGGESFLTSILIDYWRDAGRQDWLHENYCLLPEELLALKRKEQEDIDS